MNHADEADEIDGAVLVETVSVPAWVQALLPERANVAELLVLPKTVRDGRGEYRDTDLMPVKMLREAGVSVDWAHPPAARTFTSQYSADTALAIAVFVGQALGQHSVAQVGTWLLARVRHALTRRRPRAGNVPISVEVDRLTIEGDRREIEGFRVTGDDGELIVEAVMSLLRGDPAPNDQDHS